MRTVNTIISLFLLTTILLNGCDDVVSYENVSYDISDDLPIADEEILPTEAVKITKRSTIKIQDTSSKNKDKTVKSTINHFTNITVGVVDEQYAVVIHSSKATAAIPDVPTIPNINDQKFGDEEETPTEMNHTPTLVLDEELIVEEGPGESPYENGTITIGDDILASRGKDENETMTFDISSIDESYLLGKFNPSTHEDFTIIDVKYANRKGMYLRKDTYNAFLKMYEAAKKDGIHLKIISATRSFSSQKRIWEDKWTGRRKVDGKDLAKAIPFGSNRALKILEYSSMPGTSRHHWGTDMDLNALENEFFDKGKGKKIYDWLVANAATYGFYQPYSKKDENRPFGYNEEKWHWSYLPVAKPLTLLYAQKLNNDEVKGFKGEDTAKEIEVVQKYVLGIDEECK